MAGNLIIISMSLKPTGSSYRLHVISIEKKRKREENSLLIRLGLFWRESV